MQLASRIYDADSISAVQELYHFVWDEFCDWYIEIAKLYFPDPVEGPRTRAVLLEVLEKTLRLLHPVIPYVTEEIWQRLPHEGPSIMVAPFPVPEPGKIDVEDEAAMTRVMRLVTAIRTLRATYEVDRKRQTQRLQRRRYASTAHSRSQISRGLTPMSHRLTCGGI